MYQTQFLSLQYRFFFFNVVYVHVVCHQLKLLAQMEKIVLTDFFSSVFAEERCRSLSLTKAVVARWEEYKIWWPPDYFMAAVKQVSGGCHLKLSSCCLKFISSHQIHMWLPPETCLEATINLCGSHQMKQFSQLLSTSFPYQPLKMTTQ